MYGIHTANIKSIPSYAAADKHFRDTRKPRTARWHENQRPLRNTASRHLRLEVNIDPTTDLRYYDLCLYHTPLIRYYQPNDKGECAVHLSHYASVSSFAFMGVHGWYAGKALSTTDNRKVDLPISHDTWTSKDLYNDIFTVRLVFNAEGKLDTNKSVHMPMFRRASTSTLRAKRKAFKDRVAMILDLTDMQYTRILNEACVDLYAGQPGSSGNNNTLSRNFLTEGQVDSFRYDDEWDPETTTGLVQLAFSYAEDAFHSLMNRRAYALDGGSMWNRRYREEKVANGEPIANQIEDVRDQITPSQDEVRKGVLARLMSLALLDTPDAQKPYPEFPTPLPRSFGRFRPRPENQVYSLKDVLDKEYYEKLVNRKGVIYPA